MTERAKEYGAGLYELAEEERIVPLLHEQIVALKDQFEENPSFLRLLDTRGISLEERLSVVESFRNEIHPYILNFLKILAERGIASMFLQCAEYYHLRYNKEHGCTEAYVTSAVELTEENLNAIREKMQQLSGKKVRLITKVDPELLGGICVEMDGRKYDNSIRTKLEDLKHELSQSL